MQLGVIGLGRMRRIVVGRVLDTGHEAVAFDLSAEAVTATADASAKPAGSVADLIDRLGDDERIWFMVPAGDAVDATLDNLDLHLGGDDVVVDGSNSHFEESVRYVEACSTAYLDCGTSGGPTGAELGFSLMAGGPQWIYDELTPVFDTVATSPDGHGHIDDSDSGHCVKMVHNGVECALVQVYGGDFELLAGGHYDLDLESIAKMWDNDAVTHSWLLELCEEAFREEGSDLGDVDDHVADGSTGTWAVQEALEQEVPVPLICQSLAKRFGFRADDRFSHRLANRLRYGFGQHEVVRKDG